MSKEAMKLALEALESLKVTVSNRTEANVIDGVDLFPTQIAALRKALANEALDKMAENARELGLDYEPAPKPQRWAVFCQGCRKEWSVSYPHPGKTRKEVMQALSARGYKEASTTTLIGQMLQQSHVRNSKGLLYAINDQYVPLKGSKAWAKLQAAKAAPRKHVELVSKRTGEIINPRPAPAPTPVLMPVEKEWTPDDVIATLNVHQALALFKALRNILVG